MRLELRSGLAGDRRELWIEVGPIVVTVTEVPGVSLSDQEWRDVRLARLSFVSMWADSSVLFERDRLDGRGEDAAVYDTKHYLARVEDGAEPAKLVTGRKVLLRPAGLTADQRAEPGELLPLDLRFWRDRTTDGPLWPRLRAYARSLAREDELAEFRIASMGRVATYPFGERGRTARQRERTAIAWAATQVLAAHDDPSLLWVWTIRPEFRDKVMVVHDIDGNAVRAPFVGTHEVLGLPAGAVALNRGLPVVEGAMLAAPGYFFDHDSAARVLATLLDERRLTMADLRPTIARLVEWEAGAGQPGERLDELLTAVAMPDHGRLAVLLTRPRSMKYLVPLLMHSAELRTRLLREAADGPFSACVLPPAWTAAAWAMLEAAGGEHVTPRPAAHGSVGAALDSARSTAVGRTAARPRRTGCSPKS
jgi:hypothetical protein